MLHCVEEDVHYEREAEVLDKRYVSKEVWNLLLLFVLGGLDDGRNKVEYLEQVAKLAKIPFSKEQLMSITFGRSNHLRANKCLVTWVKLT